MNCILQKLTALLVATLLYVAAGAQDIQGTITDSLSKQPLPQATIYLTGTTGETVAATTDHKGNFRFKNLPDSLYSISVEYVGYKPYRLTNVKVRTAQPLTIQLILDRKDLKAVTVSATKPYIVQRIDKTIINVSGSPVAAGGTAWDVLVRAPGVLEQNSALQLKGKSVTVLMDGRYTNLSGEDLKSMLTAMPANGIEKIELIPNPSAKYNANAGSIINIVMVKNTKFGTNGTTTVGGGAGKYGLFNTGLTLNYRNSKLNAYGGYDYQHAEQYNERNSARTVSTEQNILDNRYETEQKNSHSFRTGLDYDIDKRNTVGVLVKGLLTYRNKTAVTSSLIDHTHAFDSSSTVAYTGKTRLLTPSVNLYYKAILDTTGKELRINADYFAYDKRLGDDFTTRYFDPKGVEYIDPLLLKAAAPAFNDLASLTADYTQTLKKGSLEAGIKASLASTDNDALWLQGNSGGWKTDTGKTNHFLYKENVYAVYLNINKTFKKFSIMAGLRAEQTYTDGRSVTLGQTTKSRYLNFFPNVAASYNASEAHQFALSYRKSIERYKYDVVNPFIVYRSQYAWYQGNPYLKPGIGHNFAFSYAYNNELFVSLTYSRFMDVLSEIYRKDNASPAVIATWDNLSSADDLELSISHAKSFFNNKWTTDNSLMFFYARYNAPASTGLNNAKITTMFSTNNVIMLPKGYKMQVTGSWLSPYVLGVFNSKARYSVDAGLSKAVLKSRSTLSLSVSDIFNTLRNNYTISSFGINSVNNDKSESRFIRMSFTYRFGNKNVKASATRRSSVENENRRMQ